jgi:uncharacterized protein (TIGR00725 family)
VQVAVIGPADSSPEEARAARAIGAGVAAAGHVVVTGGRGGVMAAATAGAADEGGTALALLPGDDATAAAAGARVVVPTGLGEARNALVVRSADVVVAVGGGWGTLSELALACRAGTPVVALGGWRLQDAVARTGHDPIVRVDSAATAVRTVLELLGRTP